MTKLKRPLYLDYAATTPVDARVVTKMVDYLSYEGTFANPASLHVSGQAALAAVEAARAQVASLINAEPERLIWTSGATEANNLALKGAALFLKRAGKHIVTCQTEHRAVLDTCQALTQEGFEITYLKPNQDGLIDLQTLQSSLRPDTLMVSIMHVNNETGVIQNIAAMGQILRSKGILFHVDGAQSLGKIPIDVKQLCVDLMSFSAHKIYGPKGIGALYITDFPKVRLAPQLHGGGQERGLRSGTLPTHQCVGMGQACLIAQETLLTDMNRMTELHNVFWQGLKDLPNVFLNGHATQRIAHIINIRFEGMDRDQLLSKLETLAISSSSACTGTNLDSSHVLRSMGLRNELAHRSLRFSFGRYTTLSDIEYAIQLIRRVYLEGIQS